MENNFCVYIHTNKQNDKKYIGITSIKPERRWQRGKGYGKGTHFRNAVEKYGWDNFEHEIIYEELSKKEACDYEIWLIVLFNTTNQDFGYNNTSGGEHFNHSEETKKKISEAKKGEKNPMYGKHCSEEAKKKLSEFFKGKREGEKNPMYGKSGSESPRSKPVVQLTKGGNFVAQYAGMNEAKRVTGIDNSKISAVCRGKRKTAGGFRWIYLEEYVK